MVGLFITAHCKKNALLSKEILILFPFVNRVVDLYYQRSEIHHKNRTIFRHCFKVYEILMNKNSVPLELVRKGERNSSVGRPLILIYVLEYSCFH